MLGKACVFVACLCTSVSAFRTLQSRPAVTFGPSHRSNIAAPLQHGPHATDHAARTAPVHMQQFNLPRGGGFEPSSLIAPAIFAGLFFSGALGWIFNFIIGFQLLLFIVPVVGVPLFQWYIKNNLLEGTCPTCSQETNTLRGQVTSCPNCGTMYTSEQVNGVFRRQRENEGKGSGVVEVDVISSQDD